MKNGDKARSFGAAAGRLLADMAGEDGRIVAVTAAMADATGFGAFKNRWPNRLFDVGIAEEHAVTRAAGMAAGGLRPFVACTTPSCSGIRPRSSWTCASRTARLLPDGPAAIGARTGPPTTVCFGLLTSATSEHLGADAALRGRAARHEFICHRITAFAIRYRAGELGAQPPMRLLCPAMGKHCAGARTWRCWRRAHDGGGAEAADLLAQRGNQRVGDQRVRPSSRWMMAAYRRLSARRLPSHRRSCAAGGFGSAVAEHCAAMGSSCGRIIALPDPSSRTAPGGI